MKHLMTLAILLGSTPALANASHEENLALTVCEDAGERLAEGNGTKATLQNSTYIGEDHYACSVMFENDEVTQVVFFTLLNGEMDKVQLNDAIKK
ncbi:hypothetical protein JCM19239_5296 [Vibrio variabilis]|uniref:Secreted protein n=1 Tax=Vibrio variabilis TaxID=990271 RepID=A0ABQ0JNQ3_9VIBR|nr:hypothetical protein JCM19239_5296 [Vibrio variabilis]